MRRAFFSHRGVPQVFISDNGSQIRAEESSSFETINFLSTLMATIQNHLFYRYKTK
jgi:hypothetical protein